MRLLAINALEDSSGAVFLSVLPGAFRATSNVET